MKFTPSITVSYHGVFRDAGVPFDIDEKDADAMSRYGVVERDTDDGEKQTKSPGRGRRRTI